MVYQPFFSLEVVGSSFLVSALLLSITVSLPFVVELLLSFGLVVILVESFLLLVSETLLSSFEEDELLFWLLFISSFLESVTTNSIILDESSLTLTSK